MQVMVTGMHRSGTSVVARLLAESGCALGRPDDLMPPKPDNPAGFWEHMRAFEINREILAAAGVDWDTAVGGEISSLSADDRSTSATAILDFITEMSDSGVWAVKDPRLAITLPLWRPLLSQPVVVWCLRNPIEVAVSLRGRNGFPVSLGIALWEAYTVEGLRVIRDLPVVTTSYNDLLHDPVAEVRRLVGSVNAAGRHVLRAPDREVIESIVQPALYRSTSTERMESEYLTEHHRRIWKLAETAGESDPEREIPTLSEPSKIEILRHRDRCASAQGEASPDASLVEETLDRLEREGARRSIETNARIAGLESRIDQLVGTASAGHDAMSAEITASEKRIITAMDDRAALCSELDTKRRELDSLQAELTRYKTVLADYQSSTGGRILDWWWRIRTRN